MSEHSRSAYAVLAVVCILAASFLAAAVRAEVPRIITYQGRLTDGAGSSVPDDNYSLSFRIYGSEAGDDLLWWSGIQAVVVTDGLFEYKLGSVAVLPDDLFSGDTVRWLGISVEADAEISPRVRLTTTAYAFQALRADSADYAGTAGLADDADHLEGLGASEFATSTHGHYLDDLSDVSTFGALTGQVIKWNGSGWSPADDELGSGAGDITAVYPGTGLSGGGETGDVTLSIADEGVTEGKIAGSAVTTTRLADDAVTAAKLADESVSSTEIVDGSVGTADLSPNCVTEGEILNGTILFEDIGQNGASVDQVIKWDGSGWSPADDELGSGAGDITAVYSGTGLSGGGETGDVTLSIADGGVTELKIAGNAVTSAKLADDAVTAAKLADASVSSTEIIDGSVGTADLSPSCVTQSEILNGTILFEDIGQNGASVDQVIKWNGSGWSPADDEQGTGAGDITAVYSGTGLTGGGETGDVTLSIADGGVTELKIASNAVTTAKLADDAVGAPEISAGAVGASELATNSVYSDRIVDGTIMDADINAGAAITAAKISGTAATQNQINHFNAMNHFHGGADFTDSVMRISSLGVRLGDGVAPDGLSLTHLERDINQVSTRYSLYSWIKNSGVGQLIGLRSIAHHTTTGSGGTCYGVQSSAESDGSNRYGLWAAADAKDADITTGYSYGVYGRAYDGNTAYGIYGYATSAITNWAGYFFGSVNVTGALYKGGGSFRIDHPLDPENKYLQHSFVESPDMMNVYNGNVELDANGEAVIVMPDYFEALNRDFRYQLTAIGAPGPNLYVAQKISGNSFRIAGGEPYMEVSWQVTGVRKDAWAEANRIQVEVDKPEDDRGLYVHPEAFGLGPEYSIDYEHVEQAEETAEARD